MTEQTEEPDVTIQPVAPAEDPAEVYDDPDMGDMPDDLPAGSYEADESDTHGAEDRP